MILVAAVVLAAIGLRACNPYPTELPPPANPRSPKTHRPHAYLGNPASQIREIDFGPALIP